MQSVMAVMRRHWLLVVTIIAECAVFAFYYDALLADDVYINIRYAANLFEGHGLVYNIGEPFEGYSAFLFVALETLLYFFVNNWLLVAKFLGIAFLVACTVALYSLGREYLTHRGFIAMFMAIIAFDPVFISGGALAMDATMYLFVTILAVMAYLRSWTYRTFPLWILFTFLAILTRADGIVFAAAFLAADTLVRLDGLNKGALLNAIRSVFTIPKLALYAGIALYFGWRFLYYGTLVTGPALVKSGLLLYNITTYEEFLMLKFRGLVFFGIMYALPLALAGLFLFANRTNPRFRFAAIFMALYFVADIIVHGIVFVDLPHYWRYHGQIIPFVYLFAVLGLEALYQGRTLWFIRLSRWIVVFAIIALALILGIRDYNLNQQMRRVGSHHDNPTYYREAGEMLARLDCGTGSMTLASTEAGAPPFFSGLYTIDLLGLNYGPIAQLVHDNDLDGIHAHVVEKNPEFLFLFKDRAPYRLLADIIETKYHIIYDPTGMPDGIALFQRNDLTCVSK